MDSARKMAEEALASSLVTLSNKPRYAHLFDEVSNLRDALRALLASEPAKAPFVSRNEEWGLRPDFTTAGVTAPPADAEPAKGTEAALTRLRDAGWAVAVHNDYRLGGEPHTFWLLTRADGRYVKGEGRTDAIALAQCERASEPAPPDGAEVREAADVLAEWDEEEVRRASPSVRRLVRALSALAVKPSAQPAGDAVREAEEELQRIDSLLARRITLDGLTRVQKIALALRVCEETDPKGEVAARYVCRGGQKGGE